MECYTFTKFNCICKRINVSHNGLCKKWLWCTSFIKYHEPLVNCQKGSTIVAVSINQH